MRASDTVSCILLQCTITKKIIIKTAIIKTTTTRLIITLTAIITLHSGKNPSLISTRTHKLTRTTFSTTADDELGLQNHFNSFSRSLH